MSLTAFGVDHVYEDHNHQLEEVKEIDERVKKYAQSTYGRLIHKLEVLETNADKFLD